MFNLPEQVNFLLDKLNSAGYEAYIVGGCVRDLLLDKTPDGKFVMPQKVIDAVAIIDMEYYFPQEEPPLISAEHKKEVFWRLVHDKDLDPRWREMYERGEVCK